MNCMGIHLHIKVKNELYGNSNAQKKTTRQWPIYRLFKQHYTGPGADEEASQLTPH